MQKKTKKGQGKAVSNNLIAMLVVALGLVLTIVNVTLVVINGPAYTGQFTTITTATVRMCVNTAPTINISNCSSVGNATVLYTCFVLGNDTDRNVTLTYNDNTSIFNIGASNGVINFSPSYYDAGNHSIMINLSDGSNCTNGYAVGIFNLTIGSTCKDPSFNMTLNYTVARNGTLTFNLTASDGNNDTLTYSIDEYGTNAYSTFGNSLSLIGNVITITPTAAHIGWHSLNITAHDGTDCPGANTSITVNVTVYTVNQIPYYTGIAGALDHTWNEDRNEINVYNLDDYFEDPDGDCLQYIVTYASQSSIVSVLVDGNVDPRAGTCTNNHFVSLYPLANYFGTEFVYFTATDTMNTSKSVLAIYTVNNVPEISISQINDEKQSAGGGGPTVLPLRCSEKWFCGEWGACVGGEALRNCTDLASCRSSKFKPNISIDCNVLDHCVDNIRNFDEEGIDCGGSCVNLCATCYDQIENCHNINGTSNCEEGIDCGGPCAECEDEEEFVEGAAPQETPFNLGYYLAIGGIAILLIVLLGWLFKKSKKKKKRTVMDKIRKLFHKKKKEKKERKPNKLVEKVKGLISKIRVKFEKEEKPVVVGKINVHSELDKIEKLIGKSKNEDIVWELGIVMRKWLLSRFNLDYEATFEEIKTIASGKDKELIRKIEPFFLKISELEYSGQEIPRKETVTLISKARKIAGRRKVNNTIGVAAIFVILLFGGLFLINPEITGRLTEQVSGELLVNGLYNQEDVLALGLEGYKSISLSGKLTRDGEAKVYLGDKVVFDSNALIVDRMSDMINTDNKVEFIEGEKQIDLVLDYNKGTPYDEDDNGISTLTEVVDLTVENTLFNGEFNEEKLCTLWTVASETKESYVCYGSTDCCWLYEVVPERDSWDDTFYLNYEKYGATVNNVVQAKTIYADYSFDIENSYSDIIESDNEEISVVFEDEYINFENVCVETCNLEEINEAELNIFVSKGELTIDKVVYSENVEEEGIKFSKIPDLTLNKNGKYNLDLGKFIDSKQIGLFESQDANGVTIEIKGDKATITADDGYEGKAYTFFTGISGEDKIVSNLIQINVMANINEEVQGEVKVGEEVKWTKRIIGQKNIVLENKPSNLVVNRINNGVKVKLEDSKIKIKQGGITKEKNEFFNPTIRGSQSIVEGDIEVVLEDDSDEFEIEYYTDGPIAIESQKGEFSKDVVVTSDVHYTDIVAFTNLNEVPIEHINLYHLVDGEKVRTEFTAFDNNNNGRIDYIEWIVPHLSNQSYEINISVLNIQSYPTVGGEWEVRFTTVGKADLTLSAINSTTYGTSLPDDLNPQSLKCGSDNLGYSLNGNKATYADYECNSTGYWTVSVLTEGVHNQMLEFGNVSGLANNFASDANGTVNLSIWDETDSVTKQAADTVIFYANYTNGSIVVGGNCTIIFQLNGTWQNQSNMTFTNGVYNYSRTIPYKGTSYFNVTCSNDTISTLTVMDNISITNTAPSVSPFGTRQFYEDSPEGFYITSNFSDPDLNDVFTYDYGPLSSTLPVSYFTLNNETGYLTISTTTTSQAGGYTLNLLGVDSSGSSIGDTMNVNINAVNDIPTFGNSSELGDCEQLFLCTVAIRVVDEENNFPVNYTLTKLSGPTPAIIVNKSVNLTNEHWLYFNFTPNQSFVGRYEFNITINDSDGGFNYGVFYLNISDTNDPPVLDYVCDVESNATEDSPFNCFANATDLDNDTLTFGSEVVIGVGSSVPTGWFNINASGYVNFTPRNEHVGTHIINITVDDGSIVVGETFNFTVYNTNDVPNITKFYSLEAIIGIEFNYNITVNDSDFYQPNNTYVNVSENLTFVENSTIFDIVKINPYTGLINFTNFTAGNYSIMLNVTDSNGTSDVLVFNLTVRANTPPSFDSSCAYDSILEGTLYNCTINATDNENDNFWFTVNVSWINQTDGVFANDNQTVNNTWILASDAQVGNYTVTFTVQDNWNITTIIRNISINNTPEYPYFNGLTSMTGTQLIPFTYNVTKNVSDDDFNLPNGDIIRYYVNYTLPSSGFTIGEYSGYISFTPSLADVGNYTIRFTVNDSFGLANYTDIPVEIQFLDDPPVWNQTCDGGVGKQGQDYSCKLNATDDATTLYFSANASWFNDSLYRIDGHNMWFNITPTNSIVGNNSVELNVSNGLLTDTVVIQFYVNNTNDQPTLNSTNLTATEDFTFNYTISVDDPDINTQDGDTFIFYTNSTLFTVNSSTGYFEFLLNVSYIGNYSILLNVTDSGNLKDSQVINLEIQSYNDYPVIPTIPSLYAEPDQAFYYDVNATDEEDGANVYYTTNVSGILFDINYTTGVISFTPNSSMIGFYRINLTVNDTEDRKSFTLFNFTVREYNSKPNITQIKPSGNSTNFVNRSLFPRNITNISTVENTTIIFAYIANDSDEINSTWYLGDTLVQNRTSLTNYTYDIGMLAAGQHNLTVIVDDNRGGNDSFTWNLTIVNLNRNPTFGKIEYDVYSEFITGAENATNITSGGLILGKNGSTYNMYGEYISEGIDLGPLVSSAYNPIGFSNISWYGEFSNGNNVTMQTRSSGNGVTWSSWSSNYVSPSGQQISSTNNTYIQYKAILQTNDSAITPNLTGVIMNHIIPDLNISQAQTMGSWLYLDHYFRDDDSDDDFNFTYFNDTRLTIVIDQASSAVSVTAPENWFGTNTMFFTATDESGESVVSNNITVSVEYVPSQTLVEYQTVTTTRTKIKTRIRTLVEPDYLEILSPSHLILFDEETVMAPIYVKNNGEVIMNGIDLTAYASNEDVEMWFSNDKVESLIPGQSVETALFMKWGSEAKEFDVIVNGSSTEPAYKDTAIISVTGLKNFQSNRSITEENLKFVRDLLQNNPECLELWEILDKAESEIKEKKYDSAKTTLNFVVRSCTVLLSNPRDVEAASPIEQNRSDFWKIITGILGMALLVTIMMIITLAYRRRS